MALSPPNHGNNSAPSVAAPQEDAPTSPNTPTARCSDITQPQEDAPTACIFMGCSGDFDVAYTQEQLPIAVRAVKEEVARRDGLPVGLLEMTTCAGDVLADTDLITGNEDNSHHLYRFGADNYQTAKGFWAASSEQKRVYVYWMHQEDGALTVQQLIDAAPVLPVLDRHYFEQDTVYTSDALSEFVSLLLDEFPCELIALLIQTQNRAAATRFPPPAWSLREQREHADAYRRYVVVAWHVARQLWRVARSVFRLQSRTNTAADGATPNLTEEQISRLLSQLSSHTSDLSFDWKRAAVRYGWRASHSFYMNPQVLPKTHLSASLSACLFAVAALAERDLVFRHVRVDISHVTESFQQLATSASSSNSLRRVERPLVVDLKKEATSKPPFPQEETDEIICFLIALKERWEEC